MKNSRVWGAGLLLLALAGAGCGRGKPIVVGSKNSTEDILLAEIAAQHLEHRLGRKVQRRLNLGGTQIVYQEFQNSGISFYPEYTGAIEAEILKEQPSTDAAALFARASGEMLRVGQAELLNPLGIDNTTVILVKREDALRMKVETLSDAAAAKDGWKVGVTVEFDEHRRLPGFEHVSFAHERGGSQHGPDIAFPGLRCWAVDLDRRECYRRSAGWARLEGATRRSSRISTRGGVLSGEAGRPGGRTQAPCNAFGTVRQVQQ